MSRPFGWIHSKTVMPVVHPTTNDLYWAAGFLDGEGSFSSCSSSMGSRASANQRDPELLERLAKMFGGRVRPRIYKNKAFDGTKYERLNSVQMYSWEITGVLARGVMMTLYKLLSARRKEQVRRALHIGARRT